MTGPVGQADRISLQDYDGIDRLSGQKPRALPSLKLRSVTFKLFQSVLGYQHLREN